MTDERPWGDAAGRAFDWIGSVAVDAEGGQSWLEAGEPYDDLYSGTAGVLLGCAEATAAGLDASRVATGARGRLLHLAHHGPDAATMPDDGVFTGWCGAALALRAWSQATGDAQAATTAQLVTRQVAHRALESSDSPDRSRDVISGDAGLLLTILADRSDTSVRAAHLLADRLVGAAEQAEGGLQWRMTANWEFLMPGFSHGTAGVAYTLASAGRALGRPDLTSVAIRGAEALLTVGDLPEGWAVPLAIPPRPKGPAVNYGWCHGPTGTVRLFVLLDSMDPRPRWKHAVDACLQALRDSRLPQRLHPGYWDNVARCCGTAGVGQLLLDRYHATGDRAMLDWADALAADVFDRAVTTPQGLTWSNTEHTADPPDLPPEPGFMQGTAGIAGWSARLGALHTRPRDSVRRIGPAWL